MFNGHAAVALAAKPLLPRVNLAWPLVAVFWVDLVWPVLLLLGIEQVKIDPGNTAFTPLEFVHYPWTHSLVMGLVWAVLFAGLYFFFRRYPRGAMVLAALVVSHWVLDVISHRPDMPIWPGGGPRIGLGLWNSLPATMVVEGVMFALGIWLYAINTEPVDRIGRLSFVGFTMSLTAIYVANLVGPPPPSVSALATLGQGQWLLIAWGYWLDRHRVAIRQW